MTSPEGEPPGKVEHGLTDEPFVPTHRLHDGSPVTQFKNVYGEFVPGMWYDEAGEGFFAGRAEPLVKPVPNAELILNGNPFPVEVTGPGRKKDTARLAGGQEVLLLQLAWLDDEARARLQISPKATARMRVKPQAGQYAGAWVSALLVCGLIAFLTWGLVEILGGRPSTVAGVRWGDAFSWSYFFVGVTVAFMPGYMAGLSMVEGRVSNIRDARAEPMIRHHFPDAFAPVPKRDRVRILASNLAFGVVCTLLVVGFLAVLYMIALEILLGFLVATHGWGFLGAREAYRRVLHGTYMEALQALKERRCEAERAREE